MSAGLLCIWVACGGQSLFDAAGADAGKQETAADAGEQKTAADAGTRPSSPDAGRPCDPTELVGSGTAEDPYEVCSANHLTIIAVSFLDANCIVTEDFDASDYSSKIAGNAPFVGLFEGGDHTVTGLSTALFTTIGNGGLVRNLTLSNADVVGAGILTNRNEGLIERVFVSGSFTANQDTGTGMIRALAKHHWF